MNFDGGGRGRLMVIIEAVFAGAESGPDLVRRKPAILEEACLFCTLVVVARWRHAELAPPGLAGRADPVYFGAGEGLLDELAVHASLAQVHADAHGAVSPPRPLADERLHVALFAQQAFRDEVADG